MFEGYKVPECTEEDVRIACIKGIDCGEAKCLPGGCPECILGEAAYKDGVTQRYLDHRWPKKVAVHCPTQELWDRVQKKAINKGYAWSIGGTPTVGYTANWKYLALCSNGKLLRGDRFNMEEVEGYKIISAEEYLGESGTITKVYINDRYLTEDEVEELFNNSNVTEEEMNKVIADVYKDKTYEEVVMVNKYFGDKVDDNDFGRILLEAHIDEVFDKAVELKAKEEEEAKED